MRRSCITSKFVCVLLETSEWFLSRRVKFDSGFNVMAVYEVSWNGPKIIFVFHRHPEVSLEVVVVETLLILVENLFDLLLELVFLHQGGCSQFLISSNEFYQPSATGNMNFPFSLVNITSFALSLFAQISNASIVSSSSMSATIMSPFQIPPAYRAYPRNNPGKTFFPNWWILDWSFA